MSSPIHTVDPVDSLVDTTKLVLGTAQLGQPYGIANTTGQPDQERAVTIIRTALDYGVSFFDTAQAYGISEQILGYALCRCNAVDKAEIITKLPLALPSTPLTFGNCVRESLLKLDVPRLYCLMLHREEHIPALDSWLGEELCRFRAEGIIRRVGVSVYKPDAALTALRHKLVSVVQIPAGLFDRRFESAGVFRQAQDTGKELHLRSVFLQGILCVHPAELPLFLSELAPALTKFHSLCREYACTPNHAALFWPLRRYPQCRVCFGAENPEQVRQNLDCMGLGDKFPEKFYSALDAILPPQKAEILNPALWPRT
jgi:aryl-alcohol dehydrogenase-like predicted oxidoreductase